MDTNPMNTIALTIEILAPFLLERCLEEAEYLRTIDLHWDGCDPHVKSADTVTLKKNRATYGMRVKPSFNTNNKLEGLKVIALTYPSVAHKYLYVGDIIIQVNNLTLTNISASDAIQILEDAGKNEDIVLSRLTDGVNTQDDATSDQPKTTGKASILKRLKTAISKFCFCC